MRVNVFRSRVQKLTTLALLLSSALILSWLENLLFMSVTVPGIKLGLSNAALTAVVYLYDPFTAFLFAVLKCLLSLTFGGRLSSLVFSLTGAVFATASMLITSRLHCFSVFGVSVSGAVLHVWGQLFAAALVFHTASLLTLMPLYTCLSVISGLIIALPVKAVISFFYSRLV